jgi:hypothetical protein
MRGARAFASDGFNVGWVDVHGAADGVSVILFLSWTLVPFGFVSCDVVAHVVELHRSAPSCIAQRSTPLECNSRLCWNGLSGIKLLAGSRMRCGPSDTLMKCTSRQTGAGLHPASAWQQVP